MLVLSRYRDESIYIGDDVVITVVDIRGDRVRIGVQAPADVSVHRQEVYEAIKNGNKKNTSQRANSDVRRVPQAPSAPKPGSAPLGQELSKRKAKMAEEAKGLPVNIDTTVEFGGLTSEGAVVPP
jgi:carbon storage regulator